ncbi:hypothetical protein QL285_018808 [Trifolium repens]|nr:hypothetical protein QL285_018804 [Trifolium repens]KAK2433555.1 hypothetical protein QL285_018808 [Trifolium repens]
MSENATGGRGSGSGSFRGRGRRNIKGNRTDIGWNYGTDVFGDAKKVKCRFCSKIVSGGIFRFKHHLAGTSEGSEPCTQVSDDVKLVMLNVIAVAKETAMKKRKMTEIAEDGGIPTMEELHMSQPQQTGKAIQSTINQIVKKPLKGTVFLYSLDTSDISKTTDKVCKMLDDAVELVGEENVIQVVTDNAANFKAGGELLMLKRKNLYWTPCAAHCIDLIFEDFEKELIIHQITIKNARKFTTYIYSRTMLITMVRKFTNGRDLIRPAMTRFATAYLTLGCLNDLKSSLINMFNSDDWKSSRFATTVEGRKIAKGALDHHFWKNILLCLKTAAPLVDVLRLVDSDAKPAMGFIYEAMDSCKKRIQSNFNNIQKYYEPVWKLIDKRWKGQLHRPLHAAAYYLNPQYHFGKDFKGDNIDVKNGLYSCVSRLVSDDVQRDKINMQLADFHFCQGPLFGSEYAKKARTTMHPAQWWDMFGDYTPELKRFAIRVLSLTCSSSGCERNWSAFEMVHTKKRNRLHQKRMNDLVYVMANMRLTKKEIRKKEPLEFVDIESDDEFLTTSDECATANNDDENVQPINDEVSVGGETIGSSNPPVPPSNNFTFGSNIEEPLSSGDEFDEVEDEDIGDDFEGLNFL